MNYYEKETKETVFAYQGRVGAEVYLCGHFTGTKGSRIPMKLEDSCWQARVQLPAGMYPYYFEVDGRHLPDGGGTVKIHQPTKKSGRWSLAIVPNWVRTRELIGA